MTSLRRFTLAVLLVSGGFAVLYWMNRYTEYEHDSQSIGLDRHPNHGVTNLPENVTDENWNFYLCRVDDAPASIFLNLALWNDISNASENTLYALQIDMADASEHGMGTPAEAKLLRAVEDSIVDEARAEGIRFVGRLRNNKIWQLTFMGPPDGGPGLNRIATSGLMSSGRSFEILIQEDEDWSYYREFLYPDTERMRWIKDRLTVEALEQHGDPLTIRRRVDHWVYFSNAVRRSAYAEAVRKLGFEAIELVPEDDGSNLCLLVHRVDSVELEAIHEVTNALAELAQEHDGDYDGWETPIKKSN